MRTLAELIRPGSKMIDEVRRGVAAAPCPCTVLPPAGNREATLLAMQQDTDSLLGAIAYETGGVLVDSAWLRFIGCGSAELPRDLALWNTGRLEGAVLVADDVLGGFFAVNQGAFGDDEDMYYWAPDSLQWEPIGFDFEFFFRWSLTGALGDFYQHYRWSSWKQDVANQLSTDHCFAFDPPLWSDSATVSGGTREVLPVVELYACKLQARQASG